MATITIENVPENVIKKYGSHLRYSSQMVLTPEKDIEDMTLLEYLQSEEYKNEKPKHYTDVEEFLSDLKK